MENGGNRLRLRVFYHDKCFDGACSASLFTRFYRERIRRHADIVERNIGRAQFIERA